MLHLIQTSTQAPSAAGYIAIYINISGSSLLQMQKKFFIMNPLSHYIRLKITPWTHFFISPESHIRKYSLYLKYDFIFNPTYRSDYLNYYTIRTIFFRQKIVSGITSLSVIKFISLFSRYYQIVRFKLNSTLVTPLSHICTLIIYSFDCSVNTFPHISSFFINIDS